MSVRATAPPTAASSYVGYEDEDRGYGWVAYAGVLLMIEVTQVA